MEYLVIGGGGFLGKRIVEMLLQRGEKVTVFDMKQTYDDDRLQGYVLGNITVLEHLVKACKGKDIVIHTASPVHGLEARIYYKVIKACKSTNVKKLIYTSSASVVYNGGDLISANETVPYCQIHMDAYNETKAIAEDAVLKANDPQGLLTIALRPSGIFGPRDSQGSLAMAQAAKKGQWRVMIGSNDNLFDMTYVDNAAYAHILAADKLSMENATVGEAFNITNDQPLFFWDIPKALFDGLGYKETMKIAIPKTLGFVLGRVMDVVTFVLSPLVQLNPSFTHFRVQLITSNRYFDISKAKERLGYRPLVSMEEALQKTVEYWLPNYGIHSK